MSDLSSDITAYRGQSANIDMKLTLFEFPKVPLNTQISSKSLAYPYKH